MSRVALIAKGLRCLSDEELGAIVRAASDEAIAALVGAPAYMAPEHLRSTGSTGSEGSPGPAEIPLIADTDRANSAGIDRIRGIAGTGLETPRDGGFRTKPNYPESCAERVETTRRDVKPANRTIAHRDLKPENVLVGREQQVLAPEERRGARPTPTDGAVWSREKILAALEAGPASGAELARRSGLSSATVDKTLPLLAQEGLVLRARIGCSIANRLPPAAATSPRPTPAQRRLQEDVELVATALQRRPLKLSPLVKETGLTREQTTRAIAALTKQGRLRRQDLVMELVDA